MGEYIVKTKNLTKNYGKFCALNRVEISVKRGEIYGLVGDNGAGKTTFLKLLSGLATPSEGEIALFGEHEEKKIEKMRNRTGVLIETPGFYPQLNVRQNLEYARIQKGVPGEKCVEEILELTGLRTAAEKKAKALSLGMKQRLGLGIALMGIPELLILDEPINGLDPSGIVEMRNLLLRLCREKNITILLSSHILSELEQMADTYGFLKDGCLLRQISRKEILKECADYVEIAVSDREKYAVLLEKELSVENYKVMPDGKVRILNAEPANEIYSRLAQEHEIDVLELSRKSQSLEEYYMNLKEGGSRLC